MNDIPQAVADRCLHCRSRPVQSRNVSGLCADCYQALPAVAKASGSTRLDVIISRYESRMVQVYGPHGADILMRDGVSAIDGVLAEAIDWGPWRDAMHTVVRDDSDDVRYRRGLRAERRARLMRYVPPPDATLDPSRPGNAFGKTRRGARPRAELPMRVAVALWGAGLGPMRIQSAAGLVGVQISTSAIGRLLSQSQQPFDGATADRVDVLVSGVMPHAVSGPIGDPPP